jgi:hypothetical protein
LQLLVVRGLTGRSVAGGGAAAAAGGRQRRDREQNQRPRDMTKVDHLHAATLTGAHKAAIKAITIGGCHESWEPPVSETIPGIC